MKPPLWTPLETYIVAHPGVAFSSTQLARDLSLSSPEATRLIQSYLNAQRQASSTTKFVLRREGRTTGAVWHPGHRIEDVRELRAQHLDDMSIRLTRALAPDLRRMGVLNHQVAAVAEAIVRATEASLMLLAASST
jgi:hypothetical protein